MKMTYTEVFYGQLFCDQTSKAQMSQSVSIRQLIGQHQTSCWSAPNGRLVSTEFILVRTNRGIGQHQSANRCLQSR